MSGDPEHRALSTLPATLPAAAELDSDAGSPRTLPAALLPLTEAGLRPKVTGEVVRFRLNGTENFLMVGIARNHPNDSIMSCCAHYVDKEINAET